MTNRHAFSLILGLIAVCLVSAALGAAEQRPEDGVFYNSDVYEGTTIPRGMVKSLRVLEIESQNYCDCVRSTGRETDLPPCCSLRWPRCTPLISSSRPSIRPR